MEPDAPVDDIAGRRSGRGSEMLKSLVPVAVARREPEVFEQRRRPESGPPPGASATPDGPHGRSRSSGAAEAGPQLADELDVAFPATPESPAQARRLVVGWLRAALPAEVELLGDVALAVSEACTNAVLHAHCGGDGRPEDGTFRVRAGRDDTVVRVVVSDDGGGFVPRQNSPGYGLGLPIIAAVSDALSIDPAPQGRGSVVAMRFDLDRSRRSTVPRDRGVDPAEQHKGNSG
jgi:serine/threonine-protein kinase RsbW